MAGLKAKGWETDSCQIEHKIEYLGLDTDGLKAKLFKEGRVLPGWLQEDQVLKPNDLVTYGTHKVIKIWNILLDIDY